MSRKAPSFKQIINYFNRYGQDQEYTIKHNLRSGIQDDIIDEFLKNSQYVKARKNGVYMYHEVFSLSKIDNISKQKQKELLKEVTEQ